MKNRLYRLLIVVIFIIPLRANAGWEMTGLAAAIGTTTAVSAGILTGLTCTWATAGVGTFPCIGLANGVALSTGVHLNALLLSYNSATGGSAPPAGTPHYISVTLDPNQPLITPNGWTPPTSGQQQPTPPSSTAPQYFVWVPYEETGTPVRGDTVSDVIAQAVQRLNTGAHSANGPYSGVAVMTGDPSTWYVSFSSAVTPNFYNVSLYSGSCPSGFSNPDYPNRATNCVLSDITLVEKPLDGVCEIYKDSSGNFQKSRNDPDCALGQSHYEIRGIGSNTVSLNTNGSYATFTNSNGNSTVVQITNDDTANNTERQTSVYLNSGNGLTDATTQQLDPNSWAPSTPSTSILGGGSSGGAGGAGGNGTGQTVCDQHPELCSTGNMADPTVPPGTAFDNAFFQGTFDGLKGWTVPAHTSNCPTATIDLTAVPAVHRTLTLDYQCTLGETIRAPLSAVSIVVFTIMALFIVLGA